MASIDDPLGLDNLNTDDFHDNDEPDEKADIIPTNLKDPLGLDETGKKAKKRRGSLKTGDLKNKKSKKSKNFAKKGEIYPHGNYHQYYGYRNQEKFTDYRIDLIDTEWIRDQDVLDIGCNAGHLTLLLARDMRPRKIVGVDIDPALISYAQKNIRHYCPTEKKFPESFASLYGPLRAPYVNTGQKSSGGKDFPENVVFIQGEQAYSNLGDN